MSRENSLTVGHSLGQRDSAVTLGTTSSLATATVFRSGPNAPPRSTSSLPTLAQKAVTEKIKLTMLGQKQGKCTKAAGMILFYFDALKPAGLMHFKTLFLCIDLVFKKLIQLV